MQGGVSCTRPCMASSAETLHGRVNLHGRAKETEAEPHMTVFRTRPCEVGREGSGAGRVSLTRPCHEAVWHPCQAYKRGFLPLFSHLGAGLWLGALPHCLGKGSPPWGNPRSSILRRSVHLRSKDCIQEDRCYMDKLSLLFSLCFEL